jgi:hypothetical protein
MFIITSRFHDFTNSRIHDFTISRFHDFRTNSRLSHDFTTFSRFHDFCMSSYVEFHEFTTFSRIHDFFMISRLSHEFTNSRIHEFTISRFHDFVQRYQNQSISIHNQPKYSRQRPNIITLSRRPPSDARAWYIGVTIKIRNFLGSLKQELSTPIQQTETP